MADLEALARDQSWGELLEHIEDIEPANRGTAWKDLLARAARARLEQPGISANPPKAVSLSETLLRRYPVLKKDKAFVDTRNKVGMEAFQRCFAEAHLREGCEKHFWGFVKQTPSDSALAMKAGKLVRRSMRHHAAVPYFHLALFGNVKSSQKERLKHCSDKDLELSVVSAISLRYGARDREVKLAQELAFGPCWDSLRQPLVDLVATDEDARKNACRGLLGKGALSGVRKKKCSLVVK